MDENIGSILEMIGEHVCSFDIGITPRPWKSPIFGGGRGRSRGRRKARSPEIFATYRSELAAIFQSAWSGNPPIESPVFLVATFQPGVERTSDVTNLLKAAEDCLQRAGVVKNDSQVLGHLVCRREKGTNPYVDISLYAAKIEKAGPIGASQPIVTPQRKIRKKTQAAH